MAEFPPTLEQVDLLKIKPTDGERKLLHFLNETLDDTYEVYFQPYLNGDRPDIIILRKNSGVMVIEVKDWDLDSYQLDPERHWEWKLKNVNNSIGKKQIVVKSPIEQVFEYKENLYNLHIESLLEKRIKNPKFLSIATCAVYFHNATKSQIDKFLTDGNQEKEKYLKFLSYFEILGSDSLTKDNFQKIISKRWLDRKSSLFDEELYKSFKRYLKPPIHTIEQGKPITYTDEQQEIIESNARIQQKIKGFAGSGKTLALAKRAVNAHLRHKSEVLILTFNISLCNYIKERISEVRENFEWKNFHVLHYHNLINTHKNNTNVIPGDNETINPYGITYQTIIIDEVQDYQEEWILNVKEFLAKDGEFVVFGDEKQNIYKRTFMKVPNTGIRGRWKILKKPFRIPADIENLVMQFQRFFFSEKYDYDEITRGFLEAVPTRLFEKSLIKYHYLDTADIPAIMNIYSSVIMETLTHDNDICFQSSRVENLRLIDKYIRDRLHKKTNTMFETLEIYEELKERFTDKEKQLKKELENIRRNKKSNFWMNSGTIKLSTIHSFKGWEIDTLFLLIENENGEHHQFTTDELIYTAITRCKKNLIIINMGNRRYDDFFKRTLKTKE